MHPNDQTVQAFDASAARYAAKYFDLRMYDAFYSAFLDLLPAPDCSVLDLACGPGSVAAYVRAHRHNARLVCADASPAMLQEAGSRVPGAALMQLDCRDLSALNQQFHGIAFCFGLSYFDHADARMVLGQIASKLHHQGALLLSSVTGDGPEPTMSVGEQGTRVVTYLRTPADIQEMVTQAGFAVLSSHCVPSPENASVQTTDVVLLARKVS